MLHTQEPTRQPCSARASESNARCVPTKKTYCLMIVRYSSGFFSFAFWM